MVLENEMAALLQRRDGLRRQTAELDMKAPFAGEVSVNAGGAAAATLVRVVLQCYYRDDRVMISLGQEPRSPFPKGHTVEQGDLSLLDPVRARPPIWRKVK